MAHMSIEAQDFEARKARRLVDEAARKAARKADLGAFPRDPDPTPYDIVGDGMPEHDGRWLVIIRNEYDPSDPRFEAHMFYSEAEASDYAEVYVMGEDTAVIRETYVSVQPAPACFVPSENVIVHDPRGA